MLHLAYDSGHRFGHMTTNLSKCVNGVLKGGRNLPITRLVQMTYYKLVEYFVKQKAEVDRKFVMRGKNLLMILIVVGMLTLKRQVSTKFIDLIYNQPSFELKRLSIL